MWVDEATGRRVPGGERSSTTEMVSVLPPIDLPPLTSVGVTGLVDFLQEVTTEIKIKLSESRMFTTATTKIFSDTATSERNNLLVRSQASSCITFFSVISQVLGSSALKKLLSPYI